MTKNKNAATERVINLTQTDENDAMVINQIEQFLEDSSGLDAIDSTKEYREYYVTGLIFWLKPENNLVTGEGAKFDQNFEVTRRYINLQNQVDTALGTVINDAWTCSTFLNRIDAATLGSGNIGILSF
jgi:hypothetical protein